MNYISIMKVFIGLVDHSRGIIQVNLSAMIKTEEKIVRINRRKEGEEVRVYQTFNKETRKPIGDSRFTHIQETDSEEVKMVPVEIDLETLRLEQSMWLLDFPESLDTKLKLKGSINVEDALLPKEWLNAKNWRFYLVQMSSILFTYMCGV